jgi:poly(beta-D-mannuronate) lyase
MVLFPNAHLQTQMSPEYIPQFKKFFCAVVCWLWVFAIPAHAQEAYNLPFTCQTSPNPVKDLQFESIYSDEYGNSSVIDPQAYDTYISDSRPLRLFESGLAAMANRYTQTRDPKIAACVQNWVYRWARADALLGKTNRTGEALRKWVLASVASAWAQVQTDPGLKPDRVKNLHAWLQQVAQTVIKDYSRDTQLNSRRNNHLYWAGWAVMETGVVLNDPDLVQWGLQQGRRGIADIDKDGTLPLEMTRGQQALNYHSYAAIPLFMIAETASRNGLDLYAENDSALYRLARRILHGLNDPSYFEKRTGVKQNTSRTISSTSLVWLEVYYAHTGDRKAWQWLNKLRPMRSSRVGGNATMLFGR